jgi:transposase
LTLVRVPTPVEEPVRDLVRCRETLQREVLRSRHYVLKLLARYGVVYRAGSHWSERFRQWLDQVRLPGEAQGVLQEYVQLLGYKESRRDALDREIAEVAGRTPYQPLVARLRGFRGIDTQTAMVLVTETGDFRRFRSPRELMSYYGLVPTEYSSGGTERRGAITKTGNARCRHVLLQAAWKYRHRAAVGAALRARQEGLPAAIVAQAWKAQHRLWRRFHRLHQTKPVHVAVTAVARELVGFVWAALQEAPALAAA